MPVRKLYKSEHFLRIIFGTTLFVVLCMGGLAYKYIKDLSESFKWVEHTYEVQVEIDKLNYLLKDTESNKRGFIISQDSIFLATYLSNRNHLNESLARLKFLTQDNDIQQQNIKYLRINIDKCLLVFDTTFELAQNNKIQTPEFKSNFKIGRESMNKARLTIIEMTALEKNLMHARKGASAESLSNAPLVVYYVLILSLALLLLTYAQISKNLKILKLRNQQLETFKESNSQSEIVSKHGNWIWNVESNTFEYSDNLYRLLGEPPQSFEAKLENFMSFVHPDDVEKLSAQVEKMMVEENLPFINYRIIQRNGKIRHFKAYGKLLISSEGEKRLLGTTADITDEVENYRLIEERNLELERNNKELASFNYVASHDLQEPLRKIQTFISRLEEKEADKFSGNGKIYIERIQSAAARMRALIDDLLQFSRTNKSEESLEISNMNDLLQSAKQDLAERINEKKAQINADSLPPMRVIPFQIKQLFENLISNSLKYSRADITPKIRITYSKTHAKDVPKITSSNSKIYHTIVVTDNGIGFDEDYSEKIFVLFSRLHGKNEYSGTGIGLSICKKIIENHQGYIFAEGNKNQGATFTIYLPFI